MLDNQFGGDINLPNFIIDISIIAQFLIKFIFVFKPFFSLHKLSFLFSYKAPIFEYFLLIENCINNFLWYF